MSKASVIVGDCRSVLRDLASMKFRAQCCVTSPPYFGLRDYGHQDQIGLEPSPDNFVQTMVEVFRLVWDVLADDGTLWLNMGDSYAGSGRGGNPTKESSTLQGGQFSQVASMVPRTMPMVESRRRDNEPIPRSDLRRPGLKPKDLMWMPWRVAFALQADGWHLRQDIIWHKPNPMPESVTDRCTKAHEYIFLLSKHEKYYCDMEAIVEPVAVSTFMDKRSHDDEYEAGRPERGYPGQASKGGGMLKRSGNKSRKDGIDRGCPADSSSNLCGSVPWAGNVRNKRSVWTVSTKPYAGAHFATFPPDLIEPCILAGAPVGGMVLDPFNGAGTTGLVCMKHARHYTGIELNPAYAALTEERWRNQTMGLPLETA